MMTKINFILELTNNVRTINQAGVWVYFSLLLVAFLRTAAEPRRLILQDADKMARCLAFAIWVWASGAVVIGITVGLQRAGIGGFPGHPAPWVAPFMALGNLLLALGALLVFRIMSIAKYGDWLWYAMIVADIIYLAASIW